MGFVGWKCTSDSVRSIRLLFSSVRFSEDLFSSSPSPSSLNTLTSSVLPRSSPPLDETCGMVYSQTRHSGIPACLFPHSTIGKNKRFPCTATPTSCHSRVFAMREKKMKIKSGLDDERGITETSTVYKDGRTVVVLSTRRPAFALTAR